MKSFLVKSLVVVGALASMNSQAQAEVVKFKCTTTRALKSGSVHTISFALNFKDNHPVSIAGKAGKQFKISPPYDALNSLNTYDNGGVYTTNKPGVYEVMANEIDMAITSIVLYANSDFKAGYLKTYGQTNEQNYSPVSCEVKFPSL